MLARKKNEASFNNSRRVKRPDRQKQEIKQNKPLAQKFEYY